LQWDGRNYNKWGVMRHPMVLNFINERLLDCAFFYTLHILAFGVFLLLLSSHIFSSTVAKDIAVTAFIALFLFFMLLKGAIKARISHSISFWFVIAYTFNLATYLATFLYVWLPTMFSYDDYHEEVKKVILWFLPIVAIISAWVNFLYILRKSPYGIYIFMMVRILRSFGHIATIWIPTLVAFSFAFHLIMRDSGTEPWESLKTDDDATVLQKLFIILQAITKTSTMMIGEVDANDILGTRQWIPSILVLVFEIITVILLMNLMVSLAVGDVSDLRNTAQDKILKIKVNFVIEALQLSEHVGVGGLPLTPLHKRTTNNVLVVHSDGSYFTVYDETLRIGSCLNCETKLSTR
uniref:Ion_trans domain-containing protein n=1 Tax=Haemonchus placei TaxID=6290 RepID=A0A0N4WN09_HAEPC